MLRGFTALSLGFVALLATGPIMAAGPVASIAPEQNFALVPSAGRISGARLVSMAFDTHALWSETDASGRQRIHSARLRDSRQQSRLSEQASEPVDLTRTGENLYPDVALRPDGSAAWLWVNTTPEAGRLLFAEAGRPPMALRTTTNPIGTPVLTFDERGSAYAAWTETEGGQSLLMAATRAPEGDWTTGPLSFGPRPYDLFPQIFGGSRSAELYCYAQSADRYVGRRITLRVNALPQETPLPDDIPAARLPVLYRTPERHLGAIWLEQTEFGELHFDLNPATTGERQLQELTPGSGAIAQVAVARDDSGARVWTEAASSETTTIVVVGPDGSPRRFTAQGSVSSPAVSTSANFLHVLWVSEDPETGSNGLMYRRLPR